MILDYDWTTPDGIQRLIQQLEQQERRLDEREHRLDMQEAKLAGIREIICSVLASINFDDVAPAQPTVFTHHGLDDSGFAEATHGTR